MPIRPNAIQHFKKRKALGNKEIILNIKGLKSYLKIVLLGLRIQWVTPCGFDSRLSHHHLYALSISLHPLCPLPFLFTVLTKFRKTENSTAHYVHILI